MLKDLEDIKVPIDIVDVFRPSNETPIIAEKAAKVKTKVLWLQFGIDNSDAKISENLISLCF